MVRPRMQPTHPLTVYVVAPSVAYVCPQMGSLATVGHASACPPLRLLTAATQAHLSLLVVVAFAVPILACVHSWTGPLTVVTAVPQAYA